MTDTVMEAPTLEKVKELLIKELTEYSAQSNGKLLGTTVVTCFKNVICMDLRSSMKSLPGALLAPYNLASAQPNALMKLDGVVESISRVRS
ncbi:MAG: hypothetical protein ABIR46_02535 [Candidatus Saccharimonadales bacterium]